MGAARTSRKEARIVTLTMIDRTFVICRLLG
jgi:hypothetical protein